MGFLGIKPTIRCSKSVSVPSAFLKTTACYHYMMQIPKLEKALCYSLETGTKIIAWIHLVLQVLSLVVLISILAMGSYFVANTNKNLNPDEMDNNLDSDEMDNNLMENENKLDDSAMAVLMGAGVIIVVIFFVIFLIQFIATILLLLGAQKKRPGYMVFWMVLSVLTLIGSIGRLGMSGIVYYVISVYFLWVVYSHYMQLKATPNISKIIAEKKLGEYIPQLETPKTTLA